MRYLKINPEEPGFSIIAQSSRSQAAVMVLGPGETTGGPDNTHGRSDQWLYVLSGTGRATVNGQPLELSPGTLILIEAGEPHQVDNTGEVPLKTIDFYAPPEY